jgi:hypothetical protein
MPLDVDVSRALRSPADLASLVQAVLTASEHDEFTWIEWKNGIVLGDREGRVNIARHILGMANRPVEEASRYAGGCGYIVIGAEPGECGGVTQIDPADLDSGLRPYLGSDGPRWTPQYVSAQGKSVLVITVDPRGRGTLPAPTSLRRRSRPSGGSRHSRRLRRCRTSSGRVR